MRNLIRRFGPAFWLVGACAAGCTVTESHPLTDAGPDAATPIPGTDGGQPGADTGATTPDSGTPVGNPDSGTPANPDSGTTPTEAGTGTDAGTPGPGAEGGTPEGGTSPEAGTAEGGTPEASTPPIPLEVVPVTGTLCTITAATKWKAALYVVDKCSLSVKAALTIDPGAVIKFGPNRSMTVDTSGSINATGTAAAPIVFTSIKDDLGGDTNADGAASAPAGSDWDGITLRASGSTFDHAAFYYAGGSDDGALNVNSSVAASVKNSVFAHNRAANEVITSTPALNATDAAAGTIITGNVFYDNTIPLGINTTYSLDDSNSFDNSTAAPALPQPNKYNGILTKGCGTVAGTVTWAATKVPFVTGSPSCDYTTVAAGGTLILGDNVVIKFFNGGSIDVRGTLTAKAAATKSIVFTSIKDDAHGGDTNGDATATAPAGSDWSGITVRVAGSGFDRTQFLYAGDDSSALNVPSPASVSVTNSIFAHNKPATDAITTQPALDLSDAAAATVVKNNIFFDNTIPLSINTTFSLDDSNSFDNSAAAPAAPMPNKYNAVMVRGCAAIVSGIAWSATKVPFVIGEPNCTYLDVNGGGTLTLGNNLIVKFFLDGLIDVKAAGTLTFGTSDFFTSIKDDTHGGDTNADLAATTPAANDWFGIRINNGTDTLCQARADMAYYTPPEANGTCP